MRSSIIASGVAALLAVTASSAMADSIQFFGSSSGQGTLSLTPGLGNALSIGTSPGASGALVTDFYSAGVCGGDCVIADGYLTLTTGGQTVPGADTYDFGAGGVLNVFGDISSLGIGAPGSPVALLSANFSSANLNVSFGFGNFDGQLTDIVVDPLLGAYLFNGGDSSNLSVRLSADCGSGGACSGLITNSTTTLQLAAAPESTPEPLTLSLFGAGLVGAGVIRRRKTKTV